MKTENGDGVVNQGFSEDCPAESELDGLDVDINPAKGYHTSPTVDESTINIQSPSANRTQQTIHHDSFSSQPVMGIIPDKGQSSFCLDNTQAAPVNHITDKNDYEKMHETSALAATEVPSIPNGFPPNNCHESETADPIENRVKNDVVTNGAYFRDVRLSLDTSKIASGDQLYKESYCIESSYNGSTTSDTSDSCIDTCESKINNHYKLVFKYVVERPLFCFAVWAMLYIFWGTSALPGGSLYALTILEITALCLGYLAELMELPGLLGMLAAGLILRNVPYIDVATYLDSSVSTPFRGVSIVILLIRGALGVNTTNIVKFKNIVPPLVIGSCLLEAIAASVAVYLIIGFPIEWASLMGCIMSAMSGVAVLPYLATTDKYLSMKADPCSLSPNYQDVIVIARTACGLDAMIAITMAEVALGFVFGEGDAGKGLVKGIVEVLMGGAFGILWGCLAGGLLNDTSSHEKRTLAIFSCGVMSLIGFTKIGYPRAGPLAVFAGVLITTTLWRNRRVGGNNNEKLSAFFTLMWFLFQPLLFGIIGARTDFDIVDWTVVTKGLICLAISLLVRIVTAFFMTTWGKISTKERLYLCLAWLPKGTVQAALGPAALDTALAAKNLPSDVDFEDLGYKVMNISAATVIAAATIGCILLRFVGPRLLASK